MAKWNGLHGLKFPHSSLYSFHDYHYYLLRDWSDIRRGNGCGESKVVHGLMHSKNDDDDEVVEGKGSCETC